MNFEGLRIQEGGDVTEPSAKSERKNLSTHRSGVIITYKR